MVSLHYIKSSPQQQIFKMSEIRPQIKYNFTKIIWEDAPKVENSTSNELDGARQVQIKTQLNKLNYRYYQKLSFPPRHQSI